MVRLESLGTASLTTHALLLLHIYWFERFTSERNHGFGKYQGKTCNCSLFSLWPGAYWSHFHSRESIYIQSIYTHQHRCHQLMSWRKCNWCILPSGAYCPGLPYCILLLVGLRSVSRLWTRELTLSLTLSRLWQERERLGDNRTSKVYSLHTLV